MPTGKRRMKVRGVSKQAHFPARKRPKKTRSRTGHEPQFHLGLSFHYFVVAAQILPVDGYRANDVGRTGRASRNRSSA